MKRRLTAIGLLALALPATAHSDEVVSTDLIVTGNICTGGSLCVDGESFGTTDLRIKGTIPEIQFFDTTTGDSTWTVSVDNPMSGLANGFTIKNETNLSYPFRIEENAPDSAFFIGETGRIGLGTVIPRADIHVAGGNLVTLRLEDTSGTTRAWDFNASSTAFWIRDHTSDTVPMAIEAGAPNNTLWLEDTGNVGIGTFTPGAPLEVSNDDTFSYFRISATQAAINQSVDVTFTGGPLGTGELRYNIVDGDGPEMKLNADGDVEIGGTLTTAGSCSVGCDAVFKDAYDLPSIEDHHARTLALGHLPNVGPTRDGEPWDVTDKMGRMLNELEHAHLFIAGQQQRITRQQEELAAQRAELDETRAALAALTARLDRIDQTGQP